MREIYHRCEGLLKLWYIIDQPRFQAQQPSLCSLAYFWGKWKGKCSSGPARGPPPPSLIFRPNWGPKGRKKKLGDHPPPPTFPYLRVWMTAPPRLSQGLDPALKWHSRLSEGEIGKFLTKWTEEIRKNVRSVCKGKLRVISWKPCRGIGQSFEESLREGKLVKSLEIFRMNDNAIIDFFTPYSASFNNC